MINIIIYALGEVYEKNKTKISSDFHVIALSDEKKEDCILPIDINKCAYDYVVVFSNKYYEEIRAKLVGKYKVPIDKIVSWRLVCCEKSYDLIIPLNNILKNINFIDRSGLLYGHQDRTSKDDLYYFIGIDLKAIEESINSEDYRNKSLIFGLNYSLENLRWLDKHLTDVQTLRFSEGIVCIRGKEHNMPGAEVSLYTILHKAYGVLEQYTPISVGNYLLEGAISDKYGDEIASLNEKINECTAFYEIWKNKKDDIVAFNHYRRYFLSHGTTIDSCLQKNDVEMYLRNADAIVAEKMVWSITNYEQIRKTVEENAFETAYKIIMHEISIRQPEYVDDFNLIMNSHYMFPFHMFAMRWELFSNYCDWLFSFIIPAAKTFDNSDFDAYSKRTIGFFAERMLTVWIKHNGLAIHELPVYLMEGV